MYKEAGEYVVTLTVYGADGNSSSTKRTIVVKAANLAPSASFTYTPETVVVDTEVTFTDTSVDSDGEIVARRWTLPDNTTSTEASVKYTFTKGGTFDVTLQVTDDRGASSEVSKKIFVAGDEGIGSGSESDPWQIATADRWNEIAQSINGTQPGDYKAGDYYLVTNDVDFSGKNFIAWDSFSGQLTGNGNSLKGITATRTVAEADINADAAIFGVIRINSGTVKDLKIEATLTSNGNRIGGMTGRNNGTLDGVYFVKGTLTGVKRVGGIAGENNSVIVNCAVLGGNISSSGENAGGITGGNTNAKAFVINCYSWMGVARFIGAQYRRHHRLRRQRLVCRQLLYDNGDRCLRGHVRRSCRIRQEEQPAEHLRQFSGRRRCGKCEKHRQQCSFGMADADFQSPLARRDDVGQRERTLE